MSYYKPTKDEIVAARNKSIPDVIAPGLKVLFCGINPGLYSGATGHHFARPGNRFWAALNLGGFTERVLSPFEDRVLLEYGYGITNLVNRATAMADELSKDELKHGGLRLVAKVEQYRPRILAIVGVGAYRTAFSRPKAKLGPQEETIQETKLWVLPNPSGLNANYQLPDLARIFGELQDAVEQSGK